MLAVLGMIAELHAGVGTTLVYGLATVSAIARIAAGLSGNVYWPPLAVAGTAWLVCFALFLSSTHGFCSLPALDRDQSGEALQPT